MKKLTIYPTMLLALALIACACGRAPTPQVTPPTEVAAEPTAAPPTQAPEPTAAPEPEPVILRVGILQDLPCWNPYSCFSGIETNFLLYDRITDAGPEPGCDSVPGLANSWEVSDDGKTWTLEFDEGITFHDGAPFTAQTFADHVAWIQTTSLNYWYPETLMMESIEVLDDLTVRYTTSEPISNSPDLNFIWLYVVPPYIWGQYDDSNLWSVEYDPPIGTGPFMMTEHVPGEYIIWDAYADYHRGKPPIDRMVWQIYSNEEALINALISGEIDMTYMDVSPQYYDTLAQADTVTIEEKPGGLKFDLFFNMASEGNKHPAIDDPAVREAIDYAIDKQHLVDVSLLGHGIVCPTNWACGPMFEGELNPDLVVTPFDLDKANQILDQAGYLDTDGDGIREMADGQPLELRLFIELEVTEELTIADSLQGWLAEIGIALQTDSLEAGTWLSAIGARDYDLAMNSTKPDMDPGVMDWYQSCWSAASGASANNYAGYCSEEMDSLVAGYWYTADAEARWTSMFEAQRILNQDRPFITLAGKNSIQAYRSDRFEFPKNTCHWAGMVSPQGLMNAVVK